MFLIVLFCATARVGTAAGRTARAAAATGRTATVAGRAAAATGRTATRRPGCQFRWIRSQSVVHSLHARIRQ